MGSNKIDPPFITRFEKYLNATYPPAKGRAHTITNGAIGGTTSMMYESCANNLLPPGYHVYVLEFTSNDLTQQRVCERSPDSEWRASEARAGAWKCVSKVCRCCPHAR